MSEFSLSGFSVVVGGLRVPLWAWPVVQLGVTSTGLIIPVLLNSDGSPVPASGGATAANQATQITAEQSIQAAVANIPAKGQALAAASTPVVLTALQLAAIQSGASVTQNFFALAASGSHDIPAGAKEWTVGILTGTGTFGGVAVSSGFTDGSSKVTTGALTLTTDSASTGYMRWAT